jgi:hypothetical protein
MRIAYMRAVLVFVALGELTWSLVFYFRPDMALGLLGRVVVDPVIARQYPLYLLPCALAYAFAVVNPVRYRGIIWIAVANRAVEMAVAIVDWRARAIATSSFTWFLALELGTTLALLPAASRAPGDRHLAERSVPTEPRDRGLKILLRGFGVLQIFWFFASTIFVQVGSRLLDWKVQDPYTTQQQGIALLIIGLTSLITASDLARYRIFVWIPIASQLIGVANCFNEIRLGSITWSGAATQWTIELGIVAAFVYYSRKSLPFLKSAASLNAR